MQHSTLVNCNKRREDIKTKPKNNNCAICVVSVLILRDITVSDSHCK